MNLRQSFPAVAPPPSGFHAAGAFFPSIMTLTVMAECGASHYRELAARYHFADSEKRARLALEHADDFRRYAPYASQEVSL